MTGWRIGDPRDGVQPRWPRPSLLLLLAAAAIAACAGPGSRPPADEALRQELLARLREDQTAREAALGQLRRRHRVDPEDTLRVFIVDTANAGWLERTVAKRGWPSRSRVGADGARAAFMLVQHAERDPRFQERMLPLIERAHAAGEIEGQELALLTDRIAVRQGRLQVYGSQAHFEDDRLVLEPIADSAHVDARRARLGLMPLRKYVRFLDSMYTAQHRR